MFLHKKSFYLLLSVFIILFKSGQAHYVREEVDDYDCDDGGKVDPNPSNPDEGAKIAKYTLCQQFQAIRDLASHPAVITIIQNHWQNDFRFRKAVQFMLTSSFTTVTQQIDASATYLSMLAEFTTNGLVNNTDIKSIGNVFNCVIIPVIQEAIGQTSARSIAAYPVAVQSRSLNTVIAEVNALIPRTKFISTVSSFKGNNTDFAAFYKTVRQANFQTKVIQGFVNKDISNSIKTLRRRQIDLCELMRYAFALFAQGP